MKVKENVIMKSSASLPNRKVALVNTLPHHQGFISCMGGGGGRVMFGVPKIIFLVHPLFEIQHPVKKLF